ncbi:MAG: hypothetical protein MMC23_008525 [Stictis urceolatum]|nr:hypothetical protein [Stictis urceolata]
MFSYMYLSLSRISRFSENDGKSFDKAIVLCEYGHAMGTGPGALKEYQDAFNKFPRLCGRFIWEWANHDILTKNEARKPFYGYGGNFDNYPNDGNFVMDSLCDSEHKPGPGLSDFKSSIQPVGVESDGKELKITYLYDFVSLDGLVSYWEIVLGHGRSPVQSANAKETPPILDTASPITPISFDKHLCLVSSWSFNGTPLLIPSGGPQLTFWRSITDNDRLWDAKTWERFGLNSISTQIRNVESGKHPFGPEIDVQSYLTPPVLSRGYDVSTGYISPRERNYRRESHAQRS